MRVPVATVVVAQEVTAFPSIKSGKSATCFVPPLLFTTTFTTVSVGNFAFVMVHVFVSPTPTETSAHVLLTSIQPASAASVTEYVPAATMYSLLMASVVVPDALPLIAPVPVAVTVNTAPLPAVTVTLSTMSLPDWSSFVIVHVLFSPAASVIVPSAAQSPPHPLAPYPAILVSEAVCEPAATVCVTPQATFIPSIFA